ncbi:MAG TPA: hypothetical protein VK866_05635, partial [Acidimicrobiales bacterium]|nr:hypothetical protein [Acidimicrobiales bacterium]
MLAREAALSSSEVDDGALGVDHHAANVADEGGGDGVAGVQVVPAEPNPPHSPRNTSKNPPILVESDAVSRRRFTPCAVRPAS